MKRQTGSEVESPLEARVALEAPPALVAPAASVAWAELAAPVAWQAGMHVRVSFEP